MTITPQTTIAELSLELQRLGARRISVSFPLFGAVREMFGETTIAQYQVLIVHSHGGYGIVVACDKEDIAHAIEDARFQVEGVIAKDVTKGDIDGERH